MRYALSFLGGLVGLLAGAFISSGIFVVLSRMPNGTVTKVMGGAVSVLLFYPTPQLLGALVGAWPQSRAEGFGGAAGGLLGFVIGFGLPFLYMYLTMYLTNAPDQPQIGLLALLISLFTTPLGVLVGCHFARP